MGIGESARKGRRCRDFFTGMAWLKRTLLYKIQLSEEKGKRAHESLFKYRLRGKGGIVPRREQRKSSLWGAGREKCRIDFFTKRKR